MFASQTLEIFLWLSRASYGIQMGKGKTDYYLTTTIHNKAGAVNIIIVLCCPDGIHTQYPDDIVKFEEVILIIY